MEPVIDQRPQFGELETDEERYEFAQYVVNTPAEDRPEIDPEEAAKALAWMEAR